MLPLEKIIRTYSEFVVLALVIQDAIFRTHFCLLLFRFYQVLINFIFDIPFFQVIGQNVRLDEVHAAFLQVANSCKK
jgi:hypothetical protein